MINLVFDVPGIHVFFFLSHGVPLVIIDFLDGFSRKKKHPACVFGYIPIFRAGFAPWLVNKPFILVCSNLTGLTGSSRKHQALGLRPKAMEKAWESDRLHRAMAAMAAMTFDPDPCRFL